MTAALPPGAGADAALRDGQPEALGAILPYLARLLDLSPLAHTPGG